MGERIATSTRYCSRSDYTRLGSIQEVLPLDSILSYLRYDLEDVVFQSYIRDYVMSRFIYDQDLG